MTLLAVGLGMLTAAVALWLASARRMARLSGPRRCGGCAHELAPGQDRCPECGRAWTRSDPGAARVFGDVADRCERARRATIVSIWALGGPAVVAIALGGGYAIGTLPWWPVANAWWAAPLETGRTGEPWGPLDVEMLVLVRGVVDSPSEFGPGAAFQRVDELRIAGVAGQQRTAPATGIMEALRGAAGVTARRTGAEFGVRAARLPGADGEQAGDDWFSSIRERELDYLLQPDFRPSPWQLDSALMHAFPGSIDALKGSDARAGPMATEVLLGKDVRHRIRWGESHSGFTPQAVAMRAASEQEQIALALCMGGASALVLLIVWARFLRAYAVAPTTKALSE